MYTDSNLSFVSQDDITDVNVTETYMGEWKNDNRSKPPRLSSSFLSRLLTTSSSSFSLRRDVKEALNAFGR
jgi:hypothetical protein